MGLRETLRVARWEIGRHTTGIDKRTAVIGLVFLLVIGGAAGATAQSGVTVDEGLYTVAVDEDSPYHPVAEDASKFTVVEPEPNIVDRGGADIAIRDGYLVVDDSQKGQVAVSEFKEAVETYNDEQYAENDPQKLAFPVEVSLEYTDRGGVQTPAAEDSSRNSLDSAGSESSAGDSTVDEGESQDDTGLIESFQSGSWRSNLPVVGGGVTGEGMSGTPDSITPPFPFQSLVLALAFVVPMNFIVQAYGSSMIEERLQRRGELMLVAPISRFDIILGKTLPYLAAMLATAAGISLFVGGGLLSVAATIPIALTFLGSVFLASLFARSFKELTFVTVAASVSITSYAFIPAIFSEIHPIALISPLTIVVEELNGNAISATEFAFSTGPLLLVATTMFVLGAGIYREEDLFTQRRVHRKALDALAAWTTSYKRVPFVTAALLPFAFAAELLVLALVFPLPGMFGIVALFLSVALIEELVKSLHVYAGYAHSRFTGGLNAALLVGSVSGLGFFVAEKLTVIVQAIGITRFDVGRAAFAETAPAMSGPSAVLAALIAPLLLHVVTAAISAVGASRGRTDYVVALLVSITIHTIYNVTVVMSFV